MQREMIARAKELLTDGTVNRVVGWKRGEFAYDVTPAVFTSGEELDAGFVFDDFCGHNLSKYMIQESRKEGKALVFLKPCDTYSFNQLLKEHRILRENVYIIGIPCQGMADANRIKAKGIDGILEIESNGNQLVIHTLYGDETINREDALEERCTVCKSKKHVIYDELMGEEGEANPQCGRFDKVAQLEAMSPEERYAFWRQELSRCSAAMRAETSALPAAVKSACLTILLPVWRIRPLQTALRSPCSILFGRSMWLDAAQTAENAPGYVLSRFRCTCSTANLSRTSMSFMGNFRREKIRKLLVL